eukprot:363026-Chlamydomonas_euryale.AAC.2
MKSVLLLRLAWAYALYICTIHSALAPIVNPRTRMGWYQNTSLPFSPPQSQDPYGHVSEHLPPLLTSAILGPVWACIGTPPSPSHLRNPRTCMGMYRNTSLPFSPPQPLAFLQFDRLVRRALPPPRLP